MTDIKLVYDKANRTVVTVPRTETDNARLAENQACVNTDRELFREVPDDYYANSIHVTESGAIGINVGGHVIVMPLKDWFALACPALACPTLTYDKATRTLHHTT